MRLAVMVLASAVFFSGAACASDFVPRLSSDVWHQGFWPKTRVGNQAPRPKDIIDVEIIQVTEGKYTVSQVNALKPAYGLNDAGAFLNVRTGELFVYIPNQIDMTDPSGKFPCGKSVAFGKDQISYNVPPDMIFCTSTLLEKVQESVALKGFSMAMKLASGIASAGTNAIDTFQARLSTERLNALMTNRDVIDGLTQVSAAELALRSEKELEDQVLFDKGQQFIQQAALGESLCMSKGTGIDAFKIYGFIENVRGQKVQLRLNRIVFKGDSISITIKGVEYRKGDVIWSDAAMWSACQ